MSNPAPIPSRTGLNANQIKALQNALDARGRGKIVDVPVGQAYDANLDILARVGEDLTERFTGHFLPGSWRVRFLLLDSDIRNAYAYWMGSFEAICMTTSLAREIDALCDDVAGYLVEHSCEGSGFAYVRDVGLPPEVKRASLKALLVQGVMAFFVGHEVGHLSAGHKPVVTAAAAASGSDGVHGGELDFYVDDFIAAATTDENGANVHSLRLNAHEVDADVQGFALTAAYWLDLQEVSRSDAVLPAGAELIRAASAQPDRLLLLASTGAAIAMSLMSFKPFTDDWNKQATHPLTAVRCVVGLNVLANKLAMEQKEQLTLQLPQQCIEALSLVHSRLGSILLMAARSDGEYSQVARMLEDAPHELKLGVMFRATGVEHAVAKSNDLVRYLAELSAEFDACAPKRAAAIRVPMTSLAAWTAVAP